MSTLPGNPHAETAVRAAMSAKSNDEPDQNTETILNVLHVQAEATLAVAHELRTMALIGYHDSVLPFNAPGYEERTATIATRLGLGGEGQ